MVLPFAGIMFARAGNGMGLGMVVEDRPTECMYVHVVVVRLYDPYTIIW